MDEQAAVDLAQRWCRGEPVGFKAAPGGWFVWTGGSADTPPPAGEGRRAVIDADRQQLTRWPAWDVEEIAARLAAAGPDDRFPADVRAQLESDGWRPGRRWPDDQLDQFAATLARLTSERPIRLHDTVLGQHFCPVAVYRADEPWEVLLGESGRSLMRAGTEFYEVADDPDATVVDLLTRSTPREEFNVPDDDD